MGAEMLMLLLTAPTCLHPHFAKALTKPWESGEMQVCTSCGTRRPRPQMELPKAVKLETHEPVLKQKPANLAKADPRVLAVNNKQNTLTVHEHQQRLKREGRKPLTRGEIIQLYGWDEARNLFPDLGDFFL